LGRRGDTRWLPVLLERLKDPDVGNLWVEAAAELADPSALPLLLHLLGLGWGQGDPRPQVLDAAINRRSGFPAWEWGRHRRVK
jgi:HEAT repeat protein